MNTDYLGSLDEEQITALESVLKESVLDAMASGKLDQKQKTQVLTVDKVIAGAPKNAAPLTLYTTRNAGQDYLVGVTEDVLLREAETGTFTMVTVPKGVPALELDDGVYVLPRDLTIKDGTVKLSNVPTLTVWPNRPLDVEEFFNKNHSSKTGRFAPTAGGSGGGAESGDKPAKAPLTTKQKVVRAAVIAGVIALVVLGGYAIHKSNQGNKPSIRPPDRPQTPQHPSSSPEHPGEPVAIRKKKTQAEVLSEAFDRTGRRSKPEREAVKDYSEAGYIEVNQVLRGEHEPTKYAEDSVKKLDKAFESSAISTDGIVVHRGITSRPDFSEPGRINIIRPHFEVGQIIQDKGYVSTSVSETVAGGASFSGSGGALLRIKTKSDSKAIGGSHGESELIFPRGTAMRITSVTPPGPDGITVYDAEMI